MKYRSTRGGPASCSRITSPVCPPPHRPPTDSVKCPPMQLQSGSSAVTTSADWPIAMHAMTRVVCSIVVVIAAISSVLAVPPEHQHDSGLSRCLPTPSFGTIAARTRPACRWPNVPSGLRRGWKTVQSLFLKKHSSLGNMAKRSQPPRERSLLSPPDCNGLTQTQVATSPQQLTETGFLPVDYDDAPWSCPMNHEAEFTDGNNEIGASFEGCSHRICQSCLSTYCTIFLDSNSGSRMRCPVESKLH